MAAGPDSFAFPPQAKDPGRSGQGHPADVSVHRKAPVASPAQGGRFLGGTPNQGDHFAVQMAALFVYFPACGNLAAFFIDAKPKSLRRVQGKTDLDRQKRKTDKKQFLHDLFLKNFRINLIFYNNLPLQCQEGAMTLSLTIYLIQKQDAADTGICRIGRRWPANQYLE
jgi:hypothetical protein